MSLDFDLFLARYVSDLPLRADNPEFLPDCRTMTNNSVRHINSWIITKTSLSASIGLLLSKCEV